MTARLFTRLQMRAYLGNVPWADIEARMKRGQLPGPLWGVNADAKTARWDRNAVDRALDQASSMPGSIETETAALDRAIGLL